MNAKSWPQTYTYAGAAMPHSMALRLDQALVDRALNWTRTDPKEEEEYRRCAATLRNWFEEGLLVYEALGHRYRAGRDTWFDAEKIQFNDITIAHIALALEAGV